LQETGATEQRHLYQVLLSPIRAAAAVALQMPAQVVREAQAAGVQGQQLQTEQEPQEHLIQAAVAGLVVKARPQIQEAQAAAVLSS
jgi:hypothetical protein